MENFELRRISDRECHKDLIAESAKYALYKEVTKNRVSLGRQVARYTGHLIFSVGLALLRYGRVDIQSLLKSCQQRPELSRKH